MAESCHSSTGRKLSYVRAAEGRACNSRRSLENIDERVELDIGQDRDLAARAGMNVKANVTNQITHLVVGDQDLSVLAGHTKSSKHRKAEEMRAAGHHILIMGETEFKRALTNAGVV